MPTGFAGGVNEIRHHVSVGKDEIDNWLFLARSVGGIRAP
jgi:hypothetical protein